MPKTLSILTHQGVDGPGTAQAAEANKPKKSVRFYPEVQYIYYDKRKTMSGGLLRVDVAPEEKGRRFSHENISGIFGT